ncbi:MAG: hypothetical protein K5864_09560, partial [Bacteroidales bacterium]|nr:hypothetical protein [Bacteroidales bacterium]
TPAVIEDDRNDNRHYLLACDAVDHVSWKVEGGFILHLTQKEIWVVWRSDASVRKLRASGRYRNGIGFEVSHNE